MATSENTEIVKNLFATFGRGEIPALRALLAEDVIWHLPGAVPHNSGTYEGSSRDESFFENLCANVAVDAFEAREFVEEGNRVLVIGWSRGRLKSTGRMFENHVRDGKIVNFEEYADTQALAAAHRKLSPCGLRRST
jgi:uncharacterized protein